MPFQITTTFTCYLLPGDGAQGEAEFLHHLADPSEMYIVAYGFTLQPMIDQFIANHAAGDLLHIYLDHSQASGMAEKPQVQRLVNAGIEVTIGTSPVGSKFICHTKGIVCLDKPPWCWEGSVNFSESGWNQVNTALVFSSNDWATNFVGQFKQLRQFAWDYERSFQLMPRPPAGVTPNPHPPPLRKRSFEAPV
ncbi:MAG TPA: phospholipase D-like domain-containing protein [Thermoplasmata archaeon]|nr:phospholipase D-like domain-containing protein [Thermoplasmata archaeon]